ncbi:uncharacterized protein LOC121865619 [Homarus americanus]|uniref:uncharacterized protein LOC121865619 n=1 Tax=Homarus americanus TaxID=6706 RepID=UPI001C4589E4|nr:uncharacterized protein LOC121865619 [Homarus americanus]
MRQTVVMVAAMWVVMVAATVPRPITECQRGKQVIADNDSCTRFHICRKVSEVEFTTDIAVCRTGMIFDMITLKCIRQNEGYVQDPTSCVNFYGCHRPQQGGDGLVRRRFMCTGDLRFHPTLRYCTYKTEVPDKLCNNSVSNQQIIGHDHTRTTTTKSTPTTTTTTTTTTTRPTTTATTPSTTTAAAPVAGGGRDDIPNLVRDSNTRPVSDLTDIERITQVIKGQLLNRNKSNNRGTSRD